MKSPRASFGFQRERNQPRERLPPQRRRARWCGESFTRIHSAKAGGVSPAEVWGRSARLWISSSYSVKNNLDDKVRYDMAMRMWDAAVPRVARDVACVREAYLRCLPSFNTGENVDRQPFEFRYHSVPKEKCRETSLIPPEGSDSTVP